MMKEVICKRWFLPKWIGGITLYPFIFYQGEPSEALRKHEQVHVEQIKRIGVIKFYALYIYYNVKYGYEKNPFEVEAYKVSGKL